MEQFKRVQVIMLPTNTIIGEERLGYYQDILSLNNTKYDKSLVLYRTTDGIEISNPQHLYIISDDEIKEGDWFYNNELKKIIKAVSSKYPNERNKIIATTDTSLKLKKEVFIQGFEQLHKELKYSILPQPSQQFIEKYIESYNKGEVITDVLVEYEEINIGTNSNRGVNYLVHTFKSKLKINPKDNTITIKKLKDSWNREEVTTLIEEFRQFAWSHGCSKQDLNNWIKENL